MKIFGSGNASRGSLKLPKRKKPRRELTKKQKIKRTVLVAAIIAALCMAAAAVWFTTVRAPDPMNRPNDPTVNDAENGDEPALDMGDRVADYFTFVVGAVDEDQTRTDALMVCGFDTKNKTINLLNIPRDTMSDVSRKGAAKKINAAYGTKGGIVQTKLEIKKLIGFSPDYYLIVNFQGIADIVDAIGGVDYEIPFRMYYKDPSQHLNIDFEPGMRHMDGEEVVEFLRWRKNNGGVKTGDPYYTGGDEERIDKQQEFLKYLAAQVLKSSNISNIGKISDAVFKNVKTDLTAGEILWMGMQASGTSSEKIQMHKLPGEDSYSYAGTSWYGSFFFPDEEKTLALINEYFNPYVNKLTDLDIVSGPDKRSGSGGDSSDDTESSGSSKTHTKTTEETKTEDEPKQETPQQGSADPEGGASNSSTTQPESGGNTTTAPSEGGTSTATPGGSAATPEGSGSGTSTPEEESGSTDTTTPSDSGSDTTNPPQSGSVDPEA